MGLDLEKKNLENLTFFYRDRLERVLDGENAYRLFTRNERMRLVKRGILMYRKGISEMHVTEVARKILELT